MLPVDNLKERDLPDSGFMSKRKSFAIIHSENRFGLSFIPSLVTNGNALKSYLIRSIFIWSELQMNLF